MKRPLKFLVVSILGWQVRRLYKKNHHFTTVGVVGSIGKTSTKTVIAQVLSKEFDVQYQAGNYNDIVSIPLIFFGQSLPSLYNPLAWMGVLLRNEKVLAKPYPYEVVVLELGTDGPGQIEQLKKYLKLDYAVVTALSPEHMENFADMQAVADEELSVQSYATHVLVNRDLSPANLLKKINKPYKTYGRSVGTDYSLLGVTRKSWSITLPEKRKLLIPHLTISDVEVYSLSAAMAIGHMLGLADNEMIEATIAVEPVPGRMSVLKGKNGSLIIDDTYNASPQATMIALNTLYDHPAKQRIALLGNMNELGRLSQKLHRQIGQACDPNKLALVVTLGPDANKFLAEEAEEKGCQVIRASSPQEAARVIQKAIMTNTVILAKGSQNGVFAEEAVKLLLAVPEDKKFLVRQSSTWLKKKRQQFPQS